jgi:hypothetical protein
MHADEPLIEGDHASIRMCFPICVFLRLSAAKSPAWDQQA